MSDDALVSMQWPLPRHIRAFSTTRRRGISAAPFASLNLSAATGDDAAAVASNVDILVRAAHLPQAPRWPRQVHGVHVVDAASEGLENIAADAVFSTRAGVVCSVRTADCLPVLLCDDAGTCVAAAHAGWRGLAAGVLEATVAALPVPAPQLRAWLGPAIGADVYEVGAEVRAAFLAADPGAQSGFRPSPGGRWLADLPAIARQRLQRSGVTAVHASHLCTFSDAGRFFSHRRDGAASGRLASGIWITPGP